MNAFRVLFADGRELVTSMNCELPDAQKYYLGRLFQFGDYLTDQGDDMVRAVFVEQVTSATVTREKPHGWIA